MPHLTDETIMHSVKEDRVEMLAVLFERYHVKLYNFLLRLTGDRSASEDLVQDIFYRILKYRHTYRGDCKFQIWMYQIARNAHMDHLRKRKNNIPLDDQWNEEPAPIETPADICEKQDEITLLHQALNKLPKRKKEIIILSRYQNLKYREIAQLLECSLDSIKISIHRAMKELRRHYSDLKGGIT